MSKQRPDKYWATIAGLSGFGGALAVSGMAKIVYHLQSAAPFGGSLCSEAVEAPLTGLMSVGAVHCWGCPVAALGVALTLAAVVLAHREPRPSLFQADTACR